MVRAERVDRDGRDQRRVDTAGDGDEHVGEPVLAYVVARADDERLVHLVLGTERRLDARGNGALGRPGLGDLDLRERGRARPATRIEQALAERRPYFEVDDEEVLDELTGARDEVALLVEHERRTVEDELVLATDEVGVDDRNRRVGRACREHRLPLLQPPRVVRRRVEVHDHFRATGGLGEDRTVGAPRVLADRHADLDAADDEQRTRLGRGSEVALLVEYRVVRQQLLPVDAVHATVGTHRRRVVEVTAGLWEADDRGAAAGARRELLERLARLRDERGPQAGGLRADIR